MSLAERQDLMDQSSTVWNGGEGSVSDYVALLKPRVMSLVIFTAFVGMMLAPGSIHPVLGAVAILCIAIGAGASGALNMWYDADIDEVMSRTAKRPIPAGKITPEEAFAFGITLSIGSVLTLGLLVNWFAGAFLAFTIAFYVVIYTMWLKRSTPQNIVIGGAAGAFPPMVGWASVTGGVSLESFVLFLIIFMWTPPHFWALALFKKGDYETAGVPMLPVVAGETNTRHQILIYSILLAPIGVAPYFMGYASLFYGVASGLLGLAFVAMAADIWRKREGDVARKACIRLFKFSIFYLFMLFALLLGESLVAGI
ncbi:heme o synthase [Roseibium alexandrii]|jgi:protoheme IX farnesyltransferase|uniref:Protoheme IX farnesyltransferase n=1 Tax=Roseibium alexandrii (strain DSM 17067 / NCIMB 14079 / DFL-11) TaxID=244592 RepID=A0A5E8H6C5_ROSAD|nr:heme o synthase [Roseibium alexandrii]EEE47565.1 protoheme IX farnesyltransferase [Roseibium alexandrii DFL-11]